MDRIGRKLARRWVSLPQDYLRGGYQRIQRSFVLSSTNGSQVVGIAFSIGTLGAQAHGRYRVPRCVPQ
jgi:hypothetical protein